jgi:hypothetical protein
LRLQIETTVENPADPGHPERAVRIARKLLGKFYTPDAVAKAMAGWAIRRPGDRVLDPSYGGCAFVAAARARLEALGGRNVATRLFGVDVDRDAAAYLDGVLPAPRPVGQFRREDFLSVDVRTFGRPMAAVVGNPPYVRHHALSVDQLKAARQALPASVQLSGRAGYWAYFVLHTMRFLERGGRLALVLPSALLNAEYAGPVRVALATSFRSVRLALVRDRLFEDVDESALVMLADGFGDDSGKASLSLLPSADDLPRWCAGGAFPEQPIGLALEGRGWKTGLLPTITREAFTTTAGGPGVTTLGKLARIRIGTVTGANRFFVLTADDVRQAHLPESVLTWVLGSSSDLQRLEVTSRDLVQLLQSGRRVRLFAPRGKLSSKRALSYIATERALAAATAGHCRAREPWYAITDLTSPDAFLTYVNHRAPRIVLNRAAAQCTNAIHRLWWKRPRSLADQRLLALSFLSSLTGLSAELQGRSYGGGALKLELGEAADLAIAVPSADKMPDLDRAYGRASRDLAKGDWRGARLEADRTVLKCGLGLSRDTIDQLATAQDALRSLRVRNANAPMGETIID